jgi:NTE family protein
MNRRNFVKLAVASVLLPGCDFLTTRGKIGLALGGGGARGLAHIPMLELLDELNIQPDYIAGTSIGAVIGVMYASGMSGLQIRQLIDRLTVSKDESWLSGLFDSNEKRWWNLIGVELGRGGLIESDAFIAFLEKTMGASRFEQLNIPMKVVATDFWKREQIVFETGSLGPAIQASIAIPGLFSPIQYRGRVLVDGGLVNPVPYDLLFDDCELVIGIDVSGKRNPITDAEPSYFETLFDTMQIMQASIIREKLKYRAPDIYIRPGLEDIRVHEFDRVDEIYQQAMSARNTLSRALRNRIR